mmetsp:Transcript_12669/g.18471  ORF Transcript_12669/g.18471 Transcript_12669/m.18471 type:complete len:282 (-) Transcript_12669:1564-2409(-)
MSQKEHSYGFKLSGVSLAVLACFELFYSYKLSSLKKMKLNYIEPGGVYSENNDRIVYVSGIVRAHDARKLKDSLLGIEVKGFELLRQAEMYQRKRSSEKPSQFIKTWSSHIVPSQDFPPEKRNPSMKFFGKKLLNKGELLLEGFKLPSGSGLKIESLWGVKPEIPEKNIREKLFRLGFNIEVDGEYFYLFKGLRPEFKHPKVGDYRIKYIYRPSEVYVSAMGKQSRQKIVPFGGIFLFKEGKVAPEDLATQEESRVKNKLWRARAVGILGILSGIYLGLYN